MRRSVWIAMLPVLCLTLSVAAGCGKKQSDTESDKPPVVQTLDIKPDTSDEESGETANDDESGPDITGPDN